MDGLKTILDRIRKPHVFLFRDNGAHFQSLAAVWLFVSTQTEEVKRLLSPGKEFL